MVRSVRPHQILRAASRTVGFSIVELITVLLLVSILSAVGISRSVTPSSFEAAIVNQFLVSELRFARRTAMNRQDVSIVLVLSRTSDEIIVELQTPAALSLRNRSVSRGRVELQAGSQTLDVGESFVVSLDGQGRVSTITLAGVPTATGNGLEIAVTGERTIPLCIFPSGYALDESCA